MVVVVAPMHQQAVGDTLSGPNQGLKQPGAEATEWLYQIWNKCVDLG